MSEYCMTSKEFIALLIHIATEVNTRYINQFPYNCGYYADNGKFSWDCWNLIKSLIWGWQENETVGYYCYEPGNYGLGDWDGGTILNHCNEVSSDFSNLNDLAFLLTPDKRHAGAYVGEFKDRFGQICNVVECTTSWNSARVIGSWVDADGTRRNCKGGTANYRWAWHGQMSDWIDYGEQPTPPEPPKPERVTVDGWWGVETTKALQEVLGCRSIDGIVSRQPKSNRQYLAHAAATSWEFKGWPGYIGGSEVIKALQAKIGTGVDGYFGRGSVGALQQFLRDNGFYYGSIDHSMGPATVSALQEWINSI